MLRHLSSRIFGRNPSQACVSTDTRLYAIGDIHGRADLLRRLHRFILEDARRISAPRNVVVYLGDYIDRGPDSCSVIDLLLGEPLPGFESVHLGGNHDACLARSLVDPGIAQLWLSHGGDRTLRSYGVVPPRSLWDRDEIGRVQDDLRLALPSQHLAFFQGLNLSYVHGDYMFVHAGIRPGIPLDQQAEEDLLWIGSPFLNSRRNHGKIIVHGHHITPGPDVRRNRIGVDTGAYETGRLTCLVLQGAERYVLQACTGIRREGVLIPIPWVGEFHVTHPSFLDGASR